MYVLLYLPIVIATSEVFAEDEDGAVHTTVRVVPDSVLLGLEQVLPPIVAEMAPRSLTLVTLFDTVRLSATLVVELLIVRLFGEMLLKVGSGPGSS